MNIYVFGLNHQTAPIAIREKVFLRPMEQELLLSELKNHPAFLEAFVLSTCNRTEVYVHVLENFLPFDTIHRLILQIKNHPYDPVLRDYFYVYHNEDAVRHLLKVTSGLDSMVLGEKQILGQVKESIEKAQQRGMFQRHFNILTNIAIRAGKKAQHETQISFGGSSISWAAIVKAENFMGSLENKSVLLMGAGKMSELALGHIENKGFKKLYVMNRTACNAEALASQYGAEAVAFCDVKEILAQTDVCICSIGAPHYILDKETVERVVAHDAEKKLLLIDISMPRNIDPLAAEIPGVTLFAIDDLKEVMDTTMKIREQAIPQVEIIVENKIAEYIEKIQKLPHEDLHPDLAV
jgi:glutamyl-tRNA reductase